MFKVNNKDTRTTPQVNADWETEIGRSRDLEIQLWSITQEFSSKDFS